MAQRDASLARNRRLADLLDARFRIPGTQIRFGLDPILGLLPGAGDVAGLLAAGLIVLRGVRLGASGWTLVAVLVNAVIDAVAGFVPIIGTVFDVFYKANLRNTRLLEQHLADPEGARRTGPRSVRRIVLVVVLVLLVVSALLIAAMIALFNWLF